MGVWGRSWWARLAGGALSSLSDVTEVRGEILGLCLYGASPQGPPALSVESLGASLCRLEHSFLIHHPQCQAQGKVQRSSR